MNIFSNVLNYLTTNNIIVAILVTVVSNYIFELLSSFINHIILPFFNSIKTAQKDEEGKDRSINEITLKLGNIELFIGHFISSLIKFLTMIIVVFIGIILFKKFE